MKLFNKISIVTAAAALAFVFTANASFAQVRDTTNEQMMTQNSYHIKGKVTDAQSTHAIANAKVWIAGVDQSMNEDSTTSSVTDHFKVMTDKNGSFTLKNIPDGTYPLNVKADGYKLWKKKITVDENMDEMTIQLKSAN